MPKRKTAAPDGVVDIFSVLADEEKETQEQEENPQAGGDPALLGRIGAMEAELRRLERTNAALMANAGSYAPAAAAAPAASVAEPDFSGLPDPVTDAENYHKEVAKRITAHLKAQGDLERQQQAAAQEAVSTRNSQVSALWADFEEKYPNLAEHRDMVELSANAVASRARAKGVDVNRYMFQASEQFIEDVAADIKKRFGKALEIMGKEEEGGEAGDETPKEGTIAAAMAQVRTRGITAGIPGSGKATKGPGPQDEDDGDLLRDLQKTQKAMGII